MFSRADRLWLLALPVYLLVLIFRHEAGHAVSAVLLDGAEVTDFSILPGISAQGEFVRPHVSVAGSKSTVTRFAPYLFNLLGAAVLFPVCRYATRMPRWLWLNLVVLALFMPLFDSLGNYATGLLRARSDVGVLLARWPDLLVHLYFLGTIGLFAYGSYDVLRRRGS